MSTVYLPGFKDREDFEYRPMLNNVKVCVDQIKDGDGHIVGTRVQLAEIGCFVYGTHSFGFKIFSHVNSGSTRGIIDATLAELGKEFRKNPRLLQRIWVETAAQRKAKKAWFPADFGLNME